MTNRQFMYAVIAHMWKRGSGNLDTNDPKLHEALRDAIKEIGKARLADNGVRLYFDPITQTVGELYQTIMQLQSYRLARRSNPTFSDLQLQLNTAACAELIKHLSPNDVNLAEEFAERVLANLHIPA